MQQGQKTSHVQLLRAFNSIGLHSSMSSFVQGRKEVADVPIL